MPVCVTFECTECEFKTKRYNLWRKHLLKESHQVNSREQSTKWTVKNMKRAVVVFGLMRVKNSQVLKYFGDLALVSDFVFWTTRPDFCIIQFLHTKFRENIYSASHSIDGQNFFLRRREEIAEVEWLSICPFLAPIIKLDTDVGENSSPVDIFIDSSDEEGTNSDKEDEELSAPSIVSEESSGRSQRSRDRRSLESQSRDEKLENVSFTSSGSTRENGDIEEKKCPDLNVRQDIFEDFEALRPTEENNIENDTESRIETVWNDQMEEFYHRNLLPRDDWDLRMRAKEHVEKRLKVIYPNCILIPFGFCSTAMSRSYEKFSMFLDVNGYTLKKDGDDQFQMGITNKFEEVKNNVIKAIQAFEPGQRDLPTCRDVRTHSASSDEIEFNYVEVEIHQCKIQLSNFLATQCSRIVNVLCRLDPRVRPLLIVARHWASQHQLVTRSDFHFHPAVIQWFVIFYLTNQNILPAVITLQDRSSVALYHGGVNVAFCDEVEKLGWKVTNKIKLNPETGNPTAKEILVIAQQMFSFFGGIDLQSNIINLGSGQLMLRSCVKIKPCDIDCQVFVQHPLKRLINMTNGVDKSIANKFSSACQQSSERLWNFLNGSVQGTQNVVQLLSPRSDSSSENADRSFVDSNISNTTSPHPQPQIPADVRAGTKNSPKCKKLKNFVIQLEISQGFRDKSKTVTAPEMKHAVETHLSKVWLKFFTDFNKLIWPICFGVKLIPVSADSTSNLLLNPVQGIAIHPDRLKLVNDIRVFEKFADQLISSRISDIPRRLNDQLDSTDGSFRFECTATIQMGDENRSRAKERAQVRLKFSRLMVQNNLFKENDMKNLKIMFMELWNRYSIDRLLKFRTLDL